MQWSDLEMLALVLVLATASRAQAPAPADQAPVRKVFFSNEHVRASHVEIPAHAEVPAHRHDHDFLVLPLDDARLTSRVEGQPPAEVVLHRGQPVMRKGGFTHSETNEGDAPVHLTVVEFLVRQGEIKPSAAKPSRYCNPRSKTACVSERYLICTDRLCASEVEMGPGAVTMKHSHSTDHMVIAISDLNMKDRIEGQAATVLRTQKTGEVLFIDAGITHQLENGPTPSHFITVSWK